jgi:DNA-directed RNA polymerase subunit RPC12/RpoP
MCANEKCLAKDKSKATKKHHRLPRTTCACGDEYKLELDIDDLIMLCPRCGHKKVIKEFLVRYRD